MKAFLLRGDSMAFQALRHVAAVFGLLLAAMLPSAASAETYSFGVVPQFEPRKMFGIWQPIIDELQKRTGHRFNLVVTLTVADFEKELEKGSLDFVYGNPYHILRVNAKQGYIPLVRDRNPLRGIVLVRKDSALRNLKELDGKTLAVPSPNALGASLMVRTDLERLYGVRMKMVNVRTHSSVYLNVLNGLVDAGGGVEKNLCRTGSASAGCAAHRLHDARNAFAPDRRASARRQGGARAGAQGAAGYVGHDRRPGVARRGAHDFAGRSLDRRLPVDAQLGTRCLLGRGREVEQACRYASNCCSRYWPPAWLRWPIWNSSGRRMRWRPRRINTSKTWSGTSTQSSKVWYR
jgi:hypothetical protein